MDPPEYYGLVPASPSSHSSRNSDSGGNDTGNSSGGGLQAAAAAAGGRRQGMRNSVPPLRLLSYENSVRQFVDAAEAERYPGSNMPLLEKNWLGMSYQLQALRWVKLGEGEAGVCGLCSPHSLGLHTPLCGRFHLRR
jgi:hypothetical protein